MTRYWMISALGFAAALCLLIGGFSTSWWAYTDGQLDTHIGLREAQLCREAACSSVVLPRLGTDAGGQDWRWVRAGTGTYAAAWIAGILCFAVAGMSAARRSSSLLSRTVTVATMCAALSGGLFITWAPAFVARQPGVSMWLYFVGVAFAAVVSVTAAARARLDVSASQT